MQVRESEKILLYFKNRVTYLSGGVDSGFCHVDPSEAKPHLYHIKGIRTNLSLVQLLVQRDRLNSGDVFILVCGEDKVWLWIGSDANADERAKGSESAMAFYNGGGCYRAGSGIERWGG